MNGQVNRYKQSLKNTPKPVMPSQLSKTHIDLKGLMAYAKTKNKAPVDLPDKEKEMFIM